MLPGGDTGRSVSFWLGQVLACMGRCLGCCSKHYPIIEVDEASKGLLIQGQTVKMPSVSEDFWSTSTYEMDNNGLQSQRSISSRSTCVQTHDLHVAGNASNPPDFVNHGLILWNQTRQHWIGCSKPDDHTRQAIEPRLSWCSWNATYESLIGSDRPFSRPVPLSELVGVLVEEWEDEGMYD